ncbi:hypothetical protein V8F20_004797 [Naviculisporaceae sp. PSN 640]
MSLAPPAPQIDRPDSRVSLALSDTTYHSFHDVELYEPEIAPHMESANQDSWTSHKQKNYDTPIVQEIRRQDSGYESMVRRDSHSSHRRTSTASVTSSTRQRRTRTANPRTKSGPVSQVPRRPRQSTSPRTSYSQRPQQPTQPVTFFQFPHFITAEPEVVDETEMTVTRNYATASGNPPTQDTAPYPLPPQTTHYWTSDRTRRLEYAAIDAASRGVRGWIRRHVIPECFVPKEKRHLNFEDDRGSVVRYRLELEGEDETEKDGSRRQRRRSWWFIIRRR